MSYPDSKFDELKLPHHRELAPRENRNNCRLGFNHEGDCSPIRPDGK